MSSDVVRDQDTVVIHMHDGIRHLLKVTGDRDQKVARNRIPVKPLIGASYGDIFEISQKRKLEKLYGVELNETLDIVPSEFTNVSSEAGNNSNYVDSNTAQKLTMEDVHQLRESGKSGVEILKNLIANSNTWSSKTEFAQEKWLKRKQRKYISRLRIEKCTPASLCAVYHAKNRDKILGIRPDTLSLILSQGSIVSGRKVLVFDGAIGLIVGAAAYRMRGHGRIMGMFGGQQPHFELVDCFNLEEKDTDIIQSVASSDLGPAANQVKKNGFLKIVDEFSSEDEKGKEDQSSSYEQMDQLEPISQDECASDDEDREGQANSSSKVIATPEIIKPKRKYQSSNRSSSYLAKMQSYLCQGVESVIIASKYDPLPILTHSLVLLCPGCPFVIYHEFLEPLVLCYNYLSANELAVRMVLADSWLREFQVLSGRTHPNMYMSGTGGFILYGTYIGMIGAQATRAAEALSAKT